MAVVADASVALKWALEEEGTDRAVNLIGKETILAPDFLYLECGNVLVREVRRRVIEPAVAREAYQALRDVPVQICPISLHLDRMFALALELSHSAYDCLYLAVAISEGATVMTADRRFADAANAHPHHAGRVAIL